MNTERLSMYQNVFHTNFEKLDADFFRVLKKKLSGYLSKNFYPRIILGPKH